jgi:predicted dienelactone hydrolase
MVAAMVLILLGTAGACGTTSANVGGHGSPPPDPALTTTLPSATTTTSRPKALATEGTFAVGTTELNIVEPPPAEGAPARHLPTEVWYPAVSTGGTLVRGRTRAPFPLVVFSQGFDLGVPEYSALLADWASAGFVVAAPSYPHTDPSDPATLDESDIVNHPADLRYVITTVVDTARHPSSAISGLVDDAEIAVVGHSDGGDVSLAVAANSCCHDPRVKAAVILSGAELASFGGTYFAGGSPYVPLLVVQGSADTVNFPACSTQIYGEAGSPKFYLDLLGATHEPPYVSAGSYQQVVAQVVTDFLDAELLGQGAFRTMAHDGNVSGTAQLVEGSAAPPEPGNCPGAPS